MYYLGVPAVAQQDQQRLWNTGAQVPSPAQHSGLKDPELQLRSDPWPWNATCRRVAKKRRKEKNVSNMAKDASLHH